MTQETQRIDLNERMNWLGDLWCEVMHSAPMWPIHGYYECATCGRRHPVPWTELQM